MLELPALGLANWLITLVITDSEIVRPVRERAQQWAAKRQFPPPPPPGEIVTFEIREGKLAYMMRCSLCTGVWVGIAESLCWHPYGLLTPFALAAIGRVALISTALLDRLGQP